MEELLHYVWRHKMFPLKPMKTTEGKNLEVIDPGLPNHNAGPDFFNAKLKIDGMMWVGNVEVHMRASDWNTHGHQQDPLYNNVILHVVEVDDSEITRADGEKIPQLVLACPQEVKERYNDLKRTESFPPCYAILPTLSKITVHSWFSALQVERFQQKAEAILARLHRMDEHWEDAFMVTLARNYGFGLNGDAFEQWASRLNFGAINKHRDNLFQVEAFFFGQAGLLNDSLDDEYYTKLKHEYLYLRQKFSLVDPVDESSWRMLRLRPGNFPHVRIAQLANLYHQSESLFSQIIEAENIECIKSLLSVQPSAYWKEHYVFGKKSASSDKQMSDNTLNLILINTIIPLLYAYGMHRSSDALCERATDFLESLKAENNYIIRMWANAGLEVNCAADSQALIQLKKEYCDKRDCLRCRFGYEYLKRKYK